MIQYPSNEGFFMSIIDLVPDSNRVQIDCFKVANFTFDAQLSGSHEATKTMTENPRESGTKANDHSYLEPKTYTVTGMMTSYTPYDLVDYVAGDDIQFLKSLPIVGGIVSKTDGALGKVNLYASKVSRAVDTVSSTARKFSKYLPNSIATWLGDEPDPTSRMQEAYSTLLGIVASEQPVSIDTKLIPYSNMSLIGVQVAESTDDRSDFTLTFREMIIVETQVVNGLVVPAVTAKSAKGISTGRSANQGEAVKSKGKTSPIKQEKSSSKTSSLRSMGDLIRSKQ